MNNATTPAEAKLLPSSSQSTRWKNLWKEYRFLLGCALLPAVIVFLIYLAKGLHPFGNGSVLVLDLNAQYVYFFEALRNAVTGDASLLYSFCRSLGGEFLGIYAYYIASPLSYLVCLFPQKRMLEALLVLFLIKTSICGVTFGFYMKKTLKTPNPYAIVLFSTFFALCSYAVVQQHNTMWIDAVMWLPLLTYGMEQLIKYGKFKMYTIFLALTVFSNYYIGYMICIYCFIYFFLYYFAHNEENRNNPLGERNHFFKSLFRIAFFSMVALGIAAMIIFSAYYSLSFGKSTFSSPDWEITTNFDILDLLYKLLPGSYDTVRPEGYPFIYCGMLTLLLLPAYFLTDKYPMRQKIFSGIFIFIFIASFSLSVTDLIWHGFQYPNWLNYRYSFMLSFYLCVLACRAFSEFKTVSLKGVMGTGGLIALFCIILQKYDDAPVIKPDDYMTIWFSLILIFAYLALLGLLRKAEDKQIVAVFLVAAVTIEVFLNGLWNLNGLDYDVVYSTYSSYNDSLNKSRPIVNAVQQADPSFYRMEKTFNQKTNDNMALGIRGLSGSTSTLNEETIRFLNKLGYLSRSHWSKYFGGTPVSDSLLGMKYILSEKDIYKNYYEVFSTDPAHGYVAYKNPYALSLAYGVNDALLDFPLGFVESIPEEDVPTDEEEENSTPNADQIGNAVQALKEKLNELLGIDETLRTGEYVDEYSSPFERMNAILTSMLGEEETVEVFVPIKVTSTKPFNMIKGIVAGHSRYGIDLQDEDAYLTYTITMPETTELFFYLPSDYPREMDLTLRDEEGSELYTGTFNANDSACILSFGMQEEGKELSLDMGLVSTYFYIKNGQNSFYYIDWEVFEDVMARLAQDQYQITEYTESSFTGTFTASRESELVMTTLPYDKGWKVYVDGVEAETIKALGSLVSFYIDGNAGQTHTLEIVYRPNTLRIGTIVSLVSLGILAVLILTERKLKKIPVLRALVAVPAPAESAATTAEATNGDIPADDTPSHIDEEPSAEEEKGS